MDIMKILLPTHDYPPARGGISRYLSAIKETFPEEVNVLYWKKLPGRYAMFIEILREMKKYDALWTSHVLPIGTAAWLTSIINRKPYVVILHGMDFDLARRSIWKEWLSKKILMNARRVVVNSKALANEVIEFGVQSPLVVYPTVSDAFVESSSFISKQKSDQIRLLTVSRLVERKSHLDVIEVIKNQKNINYTIVGDGEMRKEIENKISSLGLQDRVQIMQHVSDRKLPELFAQSDIFVMPAKKSVYDREGFGIVYLEAQLFQTPVIAMNTPGVNEAVSGGILIDDISELKGAIDKLVTNQNLRSALGKKGRDFVLSDFTREKQTSKLKVLL